MARLVVSDISGEIIPDGTGATVRIEFRDPEKAPVEIDLTDAEVERLFAPPAQPSSGKKTLVEIRAKYPRAYERWSKGEEREAADAYAGGASINEIARNHERQPSAIRSRLTRLGLIQE
jgi:hypothetical protein